MSTAGAGALGTRWLRLPRLGPRSGLLWVGGTAVAGLLMAAALPLHPHLVTGLVGGGLVLVLLLLRPLLVLGTILAIGVVNLAFLTGGQRQLLSGLGGIDMNGIRLVGFVAGFAALLLIDRRMIRVALGPHGRWYFLFLAYVAGTLTMSASVLEGTRLLMKMAFPFLVYVGVRALVRSRADLDRLGTWTLAAAVVLVFLVNPLLIMGGGYTVDVSGAFHINGLGNLHNPYSQYLIAMAFLALARYIVRGRLRYLLIALGLGGWAVLTQSRTALLAAPAGLAALAIYGAVLRRNFRPLIATGLVGAALAIPLIPIVLERTFGYLPTLAELWEMLGNPAALVEAMSWMGRDRIWPVLFTGFLSSPLLGLGLGSSAPLLRSSFSATGTDVSHNEYLRLAVDTGALGLLALAVAVFVWLVASARAGLQEEDPIAREYALAAVAVIPAAAMFALTSDPFDYYSQFSQYIGFFVAGALGPIAIAGAGPRSAAPDTTFQEGARS